MNLIRSGIEANPSRFSFLVAAETIPVTYVTKSADALGPQKLSIEIFISSLRGGAAEEWSTKKKRNDLRRN